ncbi:MAG: diacylglycerol kinase family lipid kinase [Lachnospiraceae bacterium]|nr:diacylglycerol kinase family lipid kinase [Lachnospiraceae bacterium]
MKNLLFIYNPKAGKGSIGSHLGDIVDIFTKRGYRVTIYPTQCRGDGEVIARQWAKGFVRIVCAGGDGTLDEIVTGLMSAGVRIPIGYLPTGSTNDFARSIGLPRTIKKAAETAASDRLFSCDIGRFNSRYFVYVAAFGLFTDVTYETDQGMKNIFGYSAYLAEAVKRLPAARAIPLKVTYDGNEITGSFIVGLVMNTDSVGGMRAIPGPDVKLDDGIFEVMLVRAPDNIFEFNSIAPAILDRKRNSENVLCFKCSSLTVESDEPIPWNLDGEFGGMTGMAQITNIREAAEFAI